MADLPLRLTADEVAQLARCSKATIFRRRRLQPDWLPLSPMKMGRELLFERADVIKALALAPEEPANDADEWKVDGDAIRKARSGALRERARPAGGRNLPGAVRAAAKASPIRLVSDNTSPDQR